MRNGMKKYWILFVMVLMACGSFAETKAILVACKDLGSISDEPVATLLDQKGYAVTICKQNDLPDVKLENFDAAVISANADADNEAVLNLIRGGQIPVLNMQGFTYAQGRLSWGEPHSGTLESRDNKCFDIYVEHPEHPIFKGFDNLETGSRISILDDMEERGLMPIQVDLPGTWCLATAYTQSIEDFYGVGEPQTSIHEIPAEMRGGNKYICLPIAMSGAYYLSDEGKKLILNIMSYLMSDEKVDIDLPFLEISAFSIEGFDAQINQAENTIELAMDAEEFKDMDSLRSVQPEITLADPDYSHVYPNEEVDLRFCPYVPKTFVVTDYISRRAYTFSIRLWRKEGIDQTEDETAPVRKEWQNGQIVIIRGNNKYTITGIKIQ
ncbi:MAG: hypothetical protein SPK90_03490 [Bacteroidales bacterium]|nr:hypothetical protein [Bacteroidales bacterium]MDY6406647.1 hypothetical protein [Bacteroidales bacterium]